MSPVPQGGVRPFIVLSYRYRLSFYRYRYQIIETLSIRYHRFFFRTILSKVSIRYSTLLVVARHSSSSRAAEVQRVQLSNLTFHFCFMCICYDWLLHALFCHAAFLRQSMYQALMVLLLLQLPVSTTSWASQGAARAVDWVCPAQ